MDKAVNNNHRIAPPDGSREPMRANIFDAMIGANAQLLPLFPYFGEGAIVPAGAVMRGGAGVTYGQFFHTNTVDEVIIAFGTHGSMTDTGFVFVGAYTHGVNSFLKNEEDPESFNVITITQRQRVGQEQSEVVTIRCTKCKEVVSEVSYDATPPPANHHADPEGERIFVTIPYSADAAEQYNASEASRTCKKCGTVNPPFPLDRWGWTEYALRSRTVVEARRALAQAAAGK